MKKPLLLVACEYSQRVTTAFLEKGFDAYSCDLIDTIGGYPERHFKMDARKAVKLKKWNLIIAHPPCTYLSTMGARHLYKNHQLNADRYAKLLEARDFFMFFWNFVDCSLCIENPTPFHIAALPLASQVVCPTMFGSSFTKRTCLWLKDLPPLLPTTAKPLITEQFVKTCHGGHNRSLIDLYLAKAMADQWAPLFF